MNLKFTIGSHGYTLFNDEGNIETVDLGRVMNNDGYDKLFITIDDWLGTKDWDYGLDKTEGYKVFLTKD